MMHRIRMLHIIRWSQHMLTIGSRVLFCRTCSESCGDGHYFSVYQRVCPWPLYLASNNLFIPLSTPSFNTLFQHPLSPPPPQSLRVSITVPLLGSSFLCLPLPPPSYRCRNHCSHSQPSTFHFTQQHNDVPSSPLIHQTVLYNPQQMVPFKRVH